MHVLAIAAVSAALALVGRPAPAHAYALDDSDRTPPARGAKMECAKGDLVSYRGTSLRYDAPATIHPAFAERLAKFEEIAREVGIEVYGRAPRVLHHAGGWVCRKTWSGRVSEHALGNALDVEGFSFEAIGRADLARAQERGVTLAPSDKRAFHLRVGHAWSAAGSDNEKRFFTLLLERTRAKDDVFRAIIGPPDPGHLGHLHFDVGPWTFSRYVLPPPRA